MSVSLAQRIDDFVKAYGALVFSINDNGLPRDQLTQNLSLAEANLCEAIETKIKNDRHNNRLVESAPLLIRFQNAYRKTNGALSGELIDVRIYMYHNFM